MTGEANGCRVFAMEISPAQVDVVMEFCLANAGRGSILDGEGRTLSQLKAEWLDKKKNADEANA